MYSIRLEKSNDKSKVKESLMHKVYHQMRIARLGEIIWKCSLGKEGCGGIKNKEHFLEGSA